MPELAYINGNFMEIGNAVVPIEDRGYQFGDAVYEFIASYNGRMFLHGRTPGPSHALHAGARVSAYGPGRH